jgi:hypothetical protein
MQLALRSIHEIQGIGRVKGVGEIEIFEDAPHFATPPRIQATALDHVQAVRRDLHGVQRHHGKSPEIPRQRPKAPVNPHFIYLAPDLRRPHVL